MMDNLQNLQSLYIPHRSKCLYHLHMRIIGTAYILLIISFFTMIISIAMHISGSHDPNIYTGFSGARTLITHLKLPGSVDQ